MHIKDRALVVAAELSDRYITNRFLPDKAIDLMDEACSSVRVQLDSKPEVIDGLERRRIRLQVGPAGGVLLIDRQLLVGRVQTSHRNLI